MIDNTNPNERSYHIPITPVPKGRPRLGRGGRVFTPKKTADAESLIKFYLMRHKPTKIESGPVRLILKFMFVRPKSAKNRVHHTVRIDLDNIIKTFCDAGNGILWHDDAQITEMTACKEYADKAGIYAIVIKI